MYHYYLENRHKNLISNMETKYALRKNYLRWPKSITKEFLIFSSWVSLPYINGLVILTLLW